MLIGVSVPLFLFAAIDYFQEDKIEATTIGILICTIGGVFSLLPGLKSMREELNSRS